MFEGITGMVSGALTTVFAPAISLGPTISLFVVASVITIIVTGINKTVFSNEKFKKLRKEMKDIQKRMKESQKKGDKDETEKLFTEMMEMNSQFMRYSYKSMLVSLIIVSLFLPWIRAEYSGMTVATMPFEMPLLGSQLGWVSWYILVSFTMGWVIRKILGFD